MTWRRCVPSSSEVCLMISEIAMLMFFSYNQTRERSEGNHCVVSSCSAFVLNGTFHFACRGVANTSKPPSYNCDELHQYLADFLSQSLYKALKGGFHAMSNPGNIHAAIRHCVCRAHNEGKHVLFAVSSTNPESTELQLEYLAAFAVAKSWQCQRSKAFLLPARFS